MTPEDLAHWEAKLAAGQWLAREDSRALIQEVRALRADAERLEVASEEFIEAQRDIVFWQMQTEKHAARVVELEQAERIRDEAMQGRIWSPNDEVTNGDREYPSTAAGS